MLRPKTVLRVAVLVASGVGLMAVDAAAINITIDYTYDASDFFGAGNPDGAAAGAEARAAVEAAAAFYSNLLDDSFAAISTPPVFDSDVFDGQVTWQSTWNFINPATGATVSIIDTEIAQDEYRVFAGARDLDGNTLGLGGFARGGGSSNPAGGFTQGEIDEINQITADFFSTLGTRGQTDGGFTAWGGTIAFDSSRDNWHYDHTSPPSSSEADFFSVVLHELGHAVGLGTAEQWSDLLANGLFTGAEAVGVFGSAPPADDDHWEQNVASLILGTGITQETLMDPDIMLGDRKLVTALDAAALLDIGWQADLPASIAGDYDADTRVTASDYSAWRDFVGPQSLGPYSDWAENFGAVSPAVAATAIPEPTTLGLLATGLLAVASRRGRSRPC
ncbi:MAG: matrixin family metalloprotease [Planctomycetota bacterium]